MNKIGPTGKFPKGKITPDDDGELAFYMGISNNKLILDFGDYVKWIGFDKESGENFIKAFQEQLAKLPDESEDH